MYWNHSQDVLQPQQNKTGNQPQEIKILDISPNICLSAKSKYLLIIVHHEGN